MLIVSCSGKEAPSQKKPQGNNLIYRVQLKRRSEPHHSRQTRRATLNNRWRSGRGSFSDGKYLLLFLVFVLFLFLVFLVCLFVIKHRAGDAVKLCAQLRQ